MRKDETTLDEDNETQNAQAMSKSKRKRMKQSRIPAEDFRSIMLANAQFYSAFSSLDLEAMKQVWLKDSRCICHFPGAKKLVGYEKIMKSWKHAVTQMEGVTRRNWMEPKEVQLEFQTSDKATVFCQEYVYSISCSIVDGELRPESELIKKLSSTNAFKKENGKWYLWYHQASPISDVVADLLVDSTRNSVVDRRQVEGGESAVGTTWHQSEITSLTMQTFESTHDTSDPFHNLDCPKLENLHCPKLVR